jgi:arylsulfatase
MAPGRIDVNMNPKRSVILFVADQCHAGWLGCAGTPGRTAAFTPNLDRLAAGGVRFTSAYTQNPICTPARVSMLSGQYCHNHGYYGLSGPSAQAPPSLFHHFKAHGYRTAAFGKLHLPDNPRDWIADACDAWSDVHRNAAGGNGEMPEYQRYLESVGLGGQDDSRSLGDVKVRGDHDSRPSRLPLEHSVDHWIARKACDFIAVGEGDDRPTFMLVSFPRPHHAITPDRRFWEMYDEDLPLPETFAQAPSHRPPNFQEKWRYLREEHQWGYEPKTLEAGSRRVWRGTLAAVTQVDHCVGMVMDKLREAGMGDDAIVIFTSDHGAYHGIHGIMEKAPGICSDAVCRVPLIWRTPEGPRGVVKQHLVEHVDLASTIPGLCGLPAMDSVDGRDVGPVLRGETDGVRDFAVTELPWSKALRWGRWRFVHYHRAMYDGEDVGELYDIEADPNETRNLYHDAAQQATVNECRRLLLEWLTASSRAITMWPTLPADRRAMKRQEPWPLAGDHRQKNGSDAGARLAAGNLAGFNARDYL